MEEIKHLTKTKMKKLLKRIIELLEEISAKLDKDVSTKSQPSGPGQPSP